MSIFFTLKKEIRSQANPLHAKNLAWFFKTGKGDYGEGDKFLGIKVPVCRSLAKQFKHLNFNDIDKLIRSKWHEDRLIALLILVQKFHKADPVNQTEIYKFYLSHTAWINNWDLVDLSAYKIVGPYLFNRDKKVLFKLAKSKNLWEKRIAIISTFYFIREKQFETSLALAELLLHDRHDLIQKAVGWMLREVGNRSLSTEIEFLKKHYKAMPRTALRYAIEKFQPEFRLAYLKGEI